MDKDDSVPALCFNDPDDPGHAAVEEDTYGSVSGWTQYAGEAWYDSLFIPNAIGGINAYFERVSEISRICRSSVDRIYEQADQADRRNAGWLRRSTEG